MIYSQQKPDQVAGNHAARLHAAQIAQWRNFALGCPWARDG